MRRWFRRLVWAFVAVVAVLGGLAAAGTVLLWRQAGRGSPADAGSATAARVPAEVVAGRDRRILFGDLHVHTSFSADAYVFSLPLLEGEGARTVADACDFARFCAGLDFWSINDHAESITPAAWRETLRAIRECNAAAGDPRDPDLISFLGWEWSQVALSAEAHYGHRNVVLRDLEPDRVPPRPIASARVNAWTLIGGILTLAAPEGAGAYADYHHFLWRNTAIRRCPDGVHVRDLPPDCREVAPTPDVLFEKLAQWGFPSVVIPHGLSWGTTNPPGASLEHQLGRMHDPERQRLLEVYSGHGNSEVWRDVRHVLEGPDGEPICPEPTPEFTPCCWRAGELARERCADPQSPRCAERVQRARQDALDAFYFQDGASFEGATLEDWGDCGQIRASFQPAFAYRPGQSAQVALALARTAKDDPAGRFRFGFVGSSDNHRARPGTGYKEFGLGAMTDGNRPLPAWADAQDGWAGRVVELAAGAKRGDSFYYTGGLVAAHAGARDRATVFDALLRREVYGTSGERILLWFDLVGPDGTRAPMGSEVRAVGTPRFEVRAAGAFAQRPGCPAHVLERLGPERTRALCLGECHHPGARRRRIERIEVVRIRPRQTPDESLAELIEDPWRVIPCEDAGDGCRVQFEDLDFAGSGREAAYYVRALQEPTPSVNGDPLSCQRDAAGRCLRARPCRSRGYDAPVPAECLAPVRERAWSSPIFVTPAGAEVLR